jgi:hypothetical protein
MTDRDLKLDEIDRSGAVREAADALLHDPAIEEAAAGGDTRAQMLRKMAMGGGALIGGGALLALPSVGAGAPSAAQDRRILNYALTLEYLEAAFYAEAVRNGALSGDVLTFARTAGAHEQAHVEFLRDALGSNAVASPSFDFKGTTRATGSFLSTAVTLEDTGVAAYLGQSFRLSTSPLTLIAAHVLVVEARHAAWVRFLTPGRVPAEDAFNGSTFQNGFPRGGYATMPQVLRAAGGFITS